MLRARVLPWVLVVPFLFGATRAGADEVVFDNGDRWSGRLVSIVDGKLRFASELAGELVVDAGRVQRFSTDEPLEIHHRDGTVFQDRVVSDPILGLRTAGLGAAGSRPLSLAETVSINPPVEPPPAWHGSALAGMTLERGNTIKDKGSADVKTGYENDALRLALRASYKGERNTDPDTHVSTTSDRNLYGESTIDAFLGQRFFWYATTSGEKDGPSELDLRFILGTGPGLRIFARDDLKANLRLGPAWVSENYEDSDMDDDSLQALAKWDVWSKLAGGVAAFHNGNFLQSFEESDDSLLKTETGLRFELTTRTFLEAALLWEWDSEPASDKSRQDVDYILGVGYAF